MSGVRYDAGDDTAMTRRLLNLLTALSLLLCVAATALWVRSYLSDGLWCRWADGRLVVVGANDDVARNLEAGVFKQGARERVGVRDLVQSLQAGRTPYGQLVRGSTPPTRVTVLGLELVVSMNSRTGVRECWALTVPGVYVALPPAVLPALWLAGFLRRRRRAAAGLCPGCGYDLRGTPGRCPECGTAASVPTTG